ncbi:hypothetical protein [Anaerotalea alkaliphila]|uniref:Uncharacterized protein n=1 Tax=Anaerotalea alkaliphila TaxID=2662126 RepID=A0A7X5HXI5_9FIRM|nr:hypothetical protein [Anaerotalea alkaliphila]NDL68321.1 hypothetical protein [Anaerotalea alkaliphila]
MKPSMDKEKAGEQANPVFPEIFKMNEGQGSHAHGSVEDNYAKTHRKPDTGANKQGFSHKPRQLPGRHQ